MEVIEEEEDIIIIIEEIIQDQDLDQEVTVENIEVITIEIMDIEKDKVQVMKKIEEVIVTKVKLVKVVEY